MDIHSHVDMKMRQAQAIHAQKMKSKMPTGMYPTPPPMGTMPSFPPKENPFGIKKGQRFG